MIAFSAVKPGYFLSFFHFLDFVATVSLPLDITSVHGEEAKQTEIERKLAREEAIPSTARSRLPRGEREGDEHV